jgi:transposase
VGACAGLTPTPYDSGNRTREQGISKAGNKRVRKLMVELAWLWLRYQQDSGLSQWFEKRFPTAVSECVELALWHWRGNCWSRYGATYHKA